MAAIAWIAVLTAPRQTSCDLRAECVRQTMQTAYWRVLAVLGDYTAVVGRLGIGKSTGWLLRQSSWQAWHLCFDFDILLPLS